MKKKVLLICKNRIRELFLHFVTDYLFLTLFYKKCVTCIGYEDIHIKYNQGNRQCHLRGAKHRLNRAYGAGCGRCQL